MRTTTFSVFDYLPAAVREFPKRRAAELAGLAALGGVVGARACAAHLVGRRSEPQPRDQRAGPQSPRPAGAIAADIAMQLLGLACIAALAPPAFWGWTLLTERRLGGLRLKAGLYLAGVAAAAALASLLPAPGSWPLPTGLGGVVGDALLALPRRLLSRLELGHGGDRRGLCDRRDSRPDGALPASASAAARDGERAGGRTPEAQAPAPRPRFDDARGRGRAGLRHGVDRRRHPRGADGEGDGAADVSPPPDRGRSRPPPRAGGAGRRLPAPPWLELKADDDGLTRPRRLRAARQSGAARSAAGPSPASPRRPAR